MDLYEHINNAVSDTEIGLNFTKDNNISFGASAQPNFLVGFSFRYFD